jgi:hypothetical protein
MASSSPITRFKIVRPKPTPWFSFSSRDTRIRTISHVASATRPEHFAVIKSVSKPVGQTSCGSKHRKGIVEKPHGRKKTIHGPIERVGVETFCSRIAWQLRHLIWRLFRNGDWNFEQRACGNHGQLYLQTGFWQEGEAWLRTRFPAESTETLAHGFFTKGLNQNKVYFLAFGFWVRG